MHLLVPVAFAARYEKRVFRGSFVAWLVHNWNDVVLLLQVAGLDAYEAMPVEAFGEAMMRGMGWQEGKSVGKNAKAVGSPAWPAFHVHFSADCDASRLADHVRSL